MAMLKYPNRTITCKYDEWARNNSDVIVTKTHNPRVALEHNNENVFYFSTRTPKMRQKVLRGNKRETARLYAKVYNSSILVVDTDSPMLDSELNIIWNYQAKFGLARELVIETMQYFKHWTILRQCCGMQMSKYWRDWLKHANSSTHKRESSTGTNSTKRQQVVQHLCLAHDIDGVARGILKTSIHAKLEKRNMRILSAPSFRDAIFFFLDREYANYYCGNYNYGVQFRGLNFNQKLPSDMLTKKHAVYPK